MSQVVREGDRLVLEWSDGANTSNLWGLNLQFLTPLLLGLLVPLIAVNYVAPDSMRHLKTPIFVVLVAMFAICSILFFITAHFPGKIHAVVVHREERTVEIVFRSMLATSSQFVPFSDISSLRARNSYDDDGYAEVAAEIVLYAQPPIRLPEGTTEAELRPLRAAIGLG